MKWWEWVALAVAAGVGAPLRYVVDSLVSERRLSTFPYGTMVVNLSGCLVLGVLSGIVIYHHSAASTRVVLGTGLVGAYTTFSTFSAETLSLLENGSPGAAATNAVISVVGGMLMSAAGLALASL